MARRLAAVLALATLFVGAACGGGAEAPVPTWTLAIGETPDGAAITRVRFTFQDIVEHTELELSAEGYTLRRTDFIPGTPEQTDDCELAYPDPGLWQEVMVRLAGFREYQDIYRAQGAGDSGSTLEIWTEGEEPEKGIVIASLDSAPPDFVSLFEFLRGLHSELRC